MFDSAAQLVAQSFKEYKYYNSNNLQAEEILCGVCRIEFPMSINVIDDIPQDIYVTAFVTTNQVPIHEYPISTTYAIRDPVRNCLTWDYVLSFPIKYKELSRNAMLLLTAWTTDGIPIGGTSMSFFDEVGCLKRGKQKLLFYLNTVADTNVIDNKTPGEAYYTSKKEKFAKYDHLFRMEKHLESFRCQQQAYSSFDLSGSDMGLNNKQQQYIENPDKYDLDWLDRLTIQQIQYVLGLNAPRGQHEDTSHLSKEAFIHGCSNEENEVYTRCWLVVEMPLLLHPVVHEEKVYPTTSALMSSSPYISSSIQNASGTHNGAVNNSCVTETERGILEFCIAGKEFSPMLLTCTKDWEFEQDNLYEEQYRRMERDAHRGGAEDSLTAAMKKPNIQEKERIDRILTATGNHLEFSDKDLLFSFRYTLTENKKALTKFLLCVDWSSEFEVNEIPTLLKLWSEKAPIDISDALKLLGREKAFQRSVVREYAVEVLCKATDDEVCMFLSQLVQALRYDTAMQQIAANGSQNNELSMSQSNRPSDAVTRAGSVSGTVTGHAEYLMNNNKLSPLANFLINRACNSVSLANYLYWYLKVETEDDTGLGPMFTAVLDAFLRRLKAIGDSDEVPGGNGELMTAQLLAADEYIAAIIACQRLGREEKGRKELKENHFRKMMETRKLDKVPSRVTQVPMPLDPKICVTGLNIAPTFMFTSALYPAVIEFTTISNIKENCVKPPVDHKDNGEYPPQPPASNIATGKCRVIFKSGDDLRQDQLVMQMFNLMDSLLKNVNLDLKLLTYGILATGPADGLMEFVSGSIAISAIMKQYNGSIGAYLKEKHPDPSEPLGISAKCMDTYVKSCAGSCVISYILGIGDRHLDNVMMKDTGQLFHIDFGFIFGRDPKPYPAPFRFTRAMVDAMGGEESEHYAKFKTLCCQAYTWLRKSANLILSLLSLMGDAGIPDMSAPLTDLPTVLAKVEERFRLDLTDEQAEQFFLGLIVETINAMAPRLFEIAHQIAVSRR